MCVWADTVTLGHLLLLRDIKRLLHKERCHATLEDLQQSKAAHLIAPNVFSMYAALPVPQ